MKTLNIKKIIYALTLSLGLISLESLAASCTANANFNQTNPAFECDPLAYTNGGTYTVNNAGNIGVGNVVTYSGIYINGGSYVSTVTNTGSILGEYAFWVDTGHVGTITNGSTTNSTALIGNIEAFSSPSSGYSFDTINNYGSINSSGAYITAIQLSGAATLNIINNYGSGTIQGDSVNGGSYSGAGNAIELESGASINAINNSGLIKGVLLGSGIYLGSGTSIGTITNNGSSAAILGGSGYYGINNFAGTITTLNNGQGGTATHTSNGNALTYYGTSPQNYNIIITSTSQYGQLVNYSSSGSVTFGISSLSTKGAGVLGNYSTVLNGITSANLGLGGATTSGTRTSNGYTFVLNETGIATNIWDLNLLSAPPLPVNGPSTADTQQSLVNTSAALQNIFTLQNSVLANSFSYDCNVFGANDVCVSAGGRNTAVSAANGLNNTSALLIAAYRAMPSVRIGAYADQNLSVNNAGSTVNLGNNTPLIGLFGAWNERLDGTGTEVKVSAAYGQKNTTVTRQVVGTSEAGSGSSQLNSQGAQVTAKYGFGVAPDVIVSPYVGMRYTQNNMNGYSEQATSSVTAPLTYSALNTNATTALAGVGASYRFIPQATAFASAGVETDTNTNNGTYSATGVTGLTPINFNANPVRTRPTAMLGASYDIEKNQRLGITGIYRQEAYQATASTTVMATYTVGL